MIEVRTSKGTRLYDADTVAKLLTQIEDATGIDVSKCELYKIKADGSEQVLPTTKLSNADCLVLREPEIPPEKKK